MAEKEVKRWITVNGKHVPIYEKEPNKESDIMRNRQQAIKLNVQKSVPDVQDSIYGVHKESHEGWWEDTSYIEPGTKEWHEPWTGYVVNYDEVERREQFEKKVVATEEQIKALRDVYITGFYHQTSSKEDFIEANKVSDIIENSTDLHLGNATLFRGADLSDKDYQKLLQGDANIDYLNGVTSWSIREDVAHMYAQGDPYTGDTYRKMHGDMSKGHRVIFVEEKTNDSMAIPYASAQDEALRSKNRVYSIEKIIPESRYKKIEDIYSAKSSGFDEPVTYIYVKSQYAKK